ncbi:restriction endonuclease [Sulfurimonas sp.]|uniref:restriction endonuclease n=1 Tax=Sulfurimonas sp. TaxID=2022749 RepID=UPI002B4993AE|nr:restriction endonuclease [Sulfurimonas sp.]
MKKEENENKIIYLKAKEIREYFKITSKQLHEVLELLKWATKSDDKGWKATKLGIDKGAKEGVYMGVNYIHWNEKIKNDFEFIDVVEGLKNSKKIKDQVNKKNVIKTKKMTDKEKKEKGDEYELFIAKHFREQGHTIAEHGKDNGVKDYGIDIIAKKDKEILFIQCKNWSANSSNKVRDKEIKVTRQDVQDYKEKYPLYEMYKTKIIYIMSENVLHGSGYHYIQDNSDVVEFRIIPMID